MQERLKFFNFLFSYTTGKLIKTACHPAILPPSGENAATGHHGNHHNRKIQLITPTLQIMQIRAYSKQELATIYFPDTDPHAATTRLTNWIKRCGPLREAVGRCQIGKHSKFFSPKQVQLIIDYLGDP